MTARYLVTGCAGFIGSCVAAKLLTAGHVVVGWDNINDAYDRRLKLWRLAKLKQHERFQFEYHDVADREAVDRGFQIQVDESANRQRVPSSRSEPPFAALLHFAARAGVRPSVENPADYVETNVTGTLNLLEACRRFGVTKVVLASTSSLYGAHNSTPYREDADTSRPLSPYAATKLAAEAMAFTYHHLHRLDISALRFFTVYGPAGRPDMSVFRFVRQIAEGEPITVFGDGEQRRDFTFVEDIANGAIAALRLLGYEVINLGNDQPATVNELINRIAALTGCEARVERQPAHAADVPETWADIAKAKRLLDWSPRVSFEEGLQRCVTWYRENRASMMHVELDIPTSSRLSQRRAA